MEKQQLFVRQKCTYICEDTFVKHLFGLTDRFLLYFLQVNVYSHYYMYIHKQNKWGKKKSLKFF